MREIADLAEMALIMAERARHLQEVLDDGLERIGELVENTAFNMMGNYQPAIGPFPAWAPLAASTEDRKARLGFPQDSPLIETEEMRNSLGHSVQGSEVQIGFKDQKAPWHEFGTSRMPPRPVLGPALFKNLDNIGKLAGAAVTAGLIGADDARGLLEGPIHESLGYNHKIV